MRNDAAVNSGNTLAAAAELAAELAETSRCAGAIFEAADAYRTAISQEEDADVRPLKRKIYKFIAPGLFTVLGLVTPICHRAKF